MKKSINLWAAPPGMPVRDVLALARDAGFEAVEPNLAEEGVPGLAAGEAEHRRFADDVRKTGLEIASLSSGLFWTHSLTANDPAVRARGAAVLAQGLRAARWLGTDAFLVVPGSVRADPDGRETVSYDTAWDRSAAAIRAALPIAEECGVSVCVENVWNKFLLSPLEMRQYVDGFGSPRVGVYFDVGNVLLTGYPEMWIRILGNRIRRIHLKDFKTAVGTGAGFCDLLEGDVDYPEVMRALGDIGYDGFLTAELGPYRTWPEAAMLNASRSMDRILGR